MPEQNGLLLRNVQLLRDLRDLLCAHDKVAEQLARHGIVRHQAEGGEAELALLLQIVRERAREQQTAVHRVGIHPGEEAGELHHIARVHQKAMQKAVVDALGGGDGAEALAVAAQQLTADRLIIGVRDGVEQRFDRGVHRLPVDGRGGYERGHVVTVVLAREADALHRHL